MCRRSSRLLMTLGCALALLRVAVTPSSAQTFTGRIDVMVTDTTGAVLPGVLVELGGQMQQVRVTDAIGEARFVNLTIGTYEVTASLDSFQPYHNESVTVETGVIVLLRVSLAVAGVTEQVQVIAETPVVDIKKQTTGEIITYEELQNIPTARDPWVVLQTVPGVVVDRVNIGGSESGQQSNYLGRGAETEDNSWYLDGIPITDMGASGSSPFYYDFDIFEEIQFVTGGAEITNPTPGVQLNGVLKSGTSVPHGNVRGYIANESLQSKNLSQELADSIGGVEGQGNRTDQFADYGFDVGGPIVRNRWWGVGIGRQDRHPEHHADQYAGPYDSQEPGVQDHGSVERPDTRQLHVLWQHENQERPRCQSNPSAELLPGTRAKGGGALGFTEDRPELRRQAVAFGRRHHSEQGLDHLSRLGVPAQRLIQHRQARARAPIVGKEPHLLAKLGLGLLASFEPGERVGGVEMHLVDRDRAGLQPT